MVSKYVKIIAVSIAVLGVIIPAFYFSFYQGPQKDIEIDLWYTYEMDGGNLDPGDGKLRIAAVAE
ncbi:unnamed protein product, partial [marine sediment metagenome]